MNWSVCNWARTPWLFALSPLWPSEGPWGPPAAPAHGGARGSRGAAPAGKGFGQSSSWFRPAQGDRQCPGGPGGRQGAAAPGETPRGPPGATSVTPWGDPGDTLVTLSPGAIPVPPWGHSRDTQCHSGDTQCHPGVTLVPPRCPPAQGAPAARRVSHPRLLLLLFEALPDPDRERVEAPRCQGIPAGQGWQCWGCTRCGFGWAFVTCHYLSKETCLTIASFSLDLVVDFSLLINVSISDRVLDSILLV